MSDDRIYCEVKTEGCARSMRNRSGYSAWLCSRHWHCTDVALREAFKKVKRTYRRCRRRGWRGTDMQTRMAIMRDLANAWDALVEDARIKTALNVEGTWPRQRNLPRAVGHRASKPGSANATSLPGLQTTQNGCESSGTRGPSSGGPCSCSRCGYPSPEHHQQCPAAPWNVVLASHQDPLDVADAMNIAYGDGP